MHDAHCLQIDAMLSACKGPHGSKYSYAEPTPWDQYYGRKSAAEYSVSTVHLPGLQYTGIPMQSARCQATAINHPGQAAPCSLGRQLQ